MREDLEMNTKYKLMIQQVEAELEKQKNREKYIQKLLVDIQTYEPIKRAIYLREIVMYRVEITKVSILDSVIEEYRKLLHMDLEADIYEGYRRISSYFCTVL